MPGDCEDEVDVCLYVCLICVPYMSALYVYIEGCVW